MQYNFKTHHAVNRNGIPVAYVQIPDTHPLFGMEYTDENFPEFKCNGGITYTGPGDLSVLNDPNNWYIGWDYSHYTPDDPMNLVAMLFELLNPAAAIQNVTEEDILRDIENVCKVLGEIQMLEDMVRG